jgi:hypothetical protein
MAHFVLGCSDPGRRARATVILREDFNTSQDYDGIVAVNPLVI